MNQAIVGLPTAIFRYVFDNIDIRVVEWEKRLRRLPCEEFADEPDNKMLYFDVISIVRRKAASLQIVPFLPCWCGHYK